MSTTTTDVRGPTSWPPSGHSRKPLPEEEPLRGLVRGVAGTAVVAGTATAVSGRVQRRRAAEFAERNAQIVAQP